METIIDTLDTLVVTDELNDTVVAYEQEPLCEPIEMSIEEFCKAINMPIDVFKKL